MKKYVCTICGFVYDEAAGIPSAGIAPGTKWDDLPGNWRCPLCGAGKPDFKEQQEEASAPASSTPVAKEEENLHELTANELSALCSNLARGCEKQYLSEESALFSQLADYFQSKAPAEEAGDIHTLLKLVQEDLDMEYVNANAAANAERDRGALRALVWGEKVSRILNSILTRYEKEGAEFLSNTNVYVCETCGFVYVGDEAPEICPVCKVPSWKIAKVERR